MTMALSPLDYYFYRPDLYTIQFVFEYHYEISPRDLRAGLELAGDLYPMTKSSLSLEKNTLTFVNPQGEIPIMEETLLSKPDQEDVSSLIEPITNAPGTPLLKFKLSFFNGTTYVGISFSHILGDGASFVMFMKSLSNFMKKTPQTMIPDHDRKKLVPKVGGKSQRTLFERTGYSMMPVESPNLEIETLIFSKIKLLRMKEEAPGLVSTNSLIMAFLAKEFKQTIIRCPVDYRGTHSQIDASYFGNAVRDAVVQFSEDEIETMSVSEMARRIQISIMSIDETSVIDSLSALHDLRVEFGAEIFRELECPGLIVTNLTKLPFHEIDLGRGSPAHIHQVPRFSHLAMILPHEEGIEVRVRNSNSDHTSKKKGQLPVPNFYVFKNLDLSGNQQVP